MQTTAAQHEMRHPVVDETVRLVTGGSRATAATWPPEPKRRARRHFDEEGGGEKPFEPAKDARGDVLSPLDRGGGGGAGG